MKPPRHLRLSIFLLALLLAAGIVIFGRSPRKAPPSSPPATGIVTSNRPAFVPPGASHNLPSLATAQDTNAPRHAASAASTVSPPARPFRDLGDGGRLTAAPGSSAGNRPVLAALQLMRQSLDLTDEQASNLAPVLAEQQAKFAALRTNNTLSRQERLAMVKEMRETADQKIKQHLAPEQARRWDQMTLGRPQLAEQRQGQQFGTAEQMQRWNKALADRQPPATPLQPTNSPSRPGQD